MADITDSTTADGSTDVNGDNTPSGTDWIDSVSTGLSGIGVSAADVIAAVNTGAKPGTKTGTTAAKTATTGSSTIWYMVGFGFVILIIAGVAFIFLKKKSKKTAA